ncbi:MAG TPA: translational GTPase TypA [Planctomycetota bacterium]
MSKDFRNVAIIAHVDHGKTTLVDALFREAGGLARGEQESERAMDSDAIERERGITILSKNASLLWKGVRINLIDTPGHADFGGQVERVLSMADGALLVVDAFEGPMPQTRFVLRKAFDNGLRPIVVINKMDRRDARAEDVISEVFDLFVDLDAEELALDFPTVFASARERWAGRQIDDRERGVAPLLDAIIDEIPAPVFDLEGPLLFQASTLDWSSFVGRIGIGRVSRGRMRKGSSVAWIRNDGTHGHGRVKELFAYRGLEREPVDMVEAGDIASVAGIVDIGLGDTLCDPEHVEQLPAIKVEEPTIDMEFRVNDSPLAGREGRFVTSRQVQERLDRAAMMDPALRVGTESGENTRVAGRGVLHLGILIENMRREGYEFCVGRPRVLEKEVDGKRMEPIEHAQVELPEDAVGRVIDFLGQRGGTVTDMERRGVVATLHFTIPTRGLIGARTQLMSLTRGEGVLNSVPAGYAPDLGTLMTRRNGVLVATESGKTTTYSLRGLEDRGEFFVDPGVEVYEGMVVGENNKDNDLPVNVVRGRKLTNVRSANKDLDDKLRSSRFMGLEAMLEYLADDELLEVTPGSLRLRKRELREKARKRAGV